MTRQGKSTLFDCLPCMRRRPVEGLNLELYGHERQLSTYHGLRRGLIKLSRGAESSTLAQQPIPAATPGRQGKRTPPTRSFQVRAIGDTRYTSLRPLQGSTGLLGRFRGRILLAIIIFEVYAQVQLIPNFDGINAYRGGSRTYSCQTRPGDA